MKKTIFFTGGHHNSALVVAQEAIKKGYRVVWLGHKYNISSSKTLSGEYKDVRSYSILFKELTTGRFYKQINFSQLILIARGFVESLLLLIKYKPSLIYSSGGYMSVPVVITGYFLGIPSVTHEQTVIAGWANKVIAPFVERVYLTYPDQYNQYPKNKSKITGMPLNPFLRRSSNKISKRKTIFVTTGKQGSETINYHFFPLVSELVKKYQVVQQIGPSYQAQKTAKKIKDSLGKNSRYYKFSSYFQAEEQSYNLKNSDLIISRAGAHTVYEIVSLAKKAILVPIPWVSHNEQLLNAKYAHKNNGNTIINEVDLTSDSLKKSIYKEISKKHTSLSKVNSNNALEKIFSDLEKKGLV